MSSAFSLAADSWTSSASLVKGEGSKVSGACLLSLEGSSCIGGNGKFAIFCLRVSYQQLCKANAHHRVILLCVGLGMYSPRLAESLTRRLESGLVDLVKTFDDVDLATGAVGKWGNLQCALVPSHRRGTRVEHFDEDDGLVGGHGKAVGKCFVIEWFASLLENGWPSFW